MSLPVATVDAVNALTARWAGALDDTATVLSGVGLWPLLALLRLGADDTAGAELDQALGADAVHGPGLLAALNDADAVRAALGLWSAPDVPLQRQWRKAVPRKAQGQLSGAEAKDRAALDGWAKKHTGGLIEQMPVGSLTDVRLLLASAIAIRTRWEQPFEDSGWSVETGPWAGADIRGLRRLSHELDQVGVAGSDAGPLSLLTCRGRQDVDVTLVLGPEGASAATVLSAAITAPAGTPGSRLQEGTPGPGLQVGEQASIEAPTLAVTTPRFRVTGQHDLAELADLFGLQSAMDPAVGHFPGISTESLFVSTARQSALAIFSAEGFEAAAVTAMTMRLTGMRQPSERTYRQITCTIDRPFGFLAVHRPTGLVLVAGWVSEPEYA